MRARIFELGLMASFVGACTLWGFGTGGFEWIKWACVLLAAGSCGLWAILRIRLQDLDRIDLFSAAMVFWISISSLWAFDQNAAFLTSSRAVLLWTVLFAGRRMSLQFFGAAAVIGVLGIISELWWFDTPFFGGSGNPNDVAQLLAIVVPLMFLRGMPFAALPGIVMFAGVVEFYLLVLSPSRMGWIALAPFIIWGWLRCSWGAKAFWAAAGFAGVAVVSYLYPDAVLRSLLPRGQIWISAAAMWLDHPFFGAGISSFQPLFPDYQSVHLLPPLGAFWPHQTFLDIPSNRPGAVHSDWLQVLVELGLVGAALAGAFVWVVLRHARGPAVLAIWSAIAVASLDFPFQKPAVILAIILAVAAATPIREPNG